MWMLETAPRQEWVCCGNWQTVVMVDVELKAALHDELRWAREAMLWKLDGLSEYDVRRPLTATGTNFLGLV